MKKITKTFLLLSLSFLLAGCNGGGSSSSSEQEPDYSMYEWGMLNLSKSKKESLAKLEKADSFTYTKDGTLYAKCTNGDYVYGKADSLRIFSKSSNHAYFDCGSSSYTYNDCRANYEEFYDKLATYCDKAFTVKEYVENTVKDDYLGAISVLNVKFYNYYTVHTEQFSDGLLCNKYVAYSLNFITDFVISGYADTDDNKLNTFYAGLDPIKAKISKYNFYRSSSKGCLIDNENEITFESISTQEAKALHDRMIDISNGEVSSDDYVEGSNNFSTKVKLSIGTPEQVTHGGKIFSSSMKITYKDDKITYKYMYADPIASSSTSSYILCHLGEVYATFEDGVNKLGLLTYGIEKTPVLGQTNNNYIVSNTKN